MASAAALAGEVAAAIIGGQPLAHAEERLGTLLPGVASLSVALATRDGSSLLLFPVLRAGALAPGLASLVAPTPPRPAARAGAGTASWMAFQAMEPLRSEEHGESTHFAFADWVAMRQEVAAVDAAAGARTFALVLATAPLEARGGVLGAVTVAARPVPPAERAGGVGGSAAACAWCGSSPPPPATAGAAGPSRAGPSAPPAASPAASPADPMLPPAPLFFPAADGLASFAAALGPSLALARADADLIAVARATGGRLPSPPKPTAVAAPVAVAPRPTVATAARVVGAAPGGAPGAPTRAGDAARLAAAGYGPDGASLSSSGSSGEEEAERDEGEGGEEADARGAGSDSCCCSSEGPPPPLSDPPPALRTPLPGGGSPPLLARSYEAYAAARRARWDGPRLALLALGGALWAARCCRVAEGAAPPSLAGRAASLLVSLLPVLPALPLAAARWACGTSPAAFAWYLSRRDGLAALPRAAAGLLALAAARAAVDDGSALPPARVAAAWLAGWALLVPARFSTLVAHQAGAAALVAAVAAGAAGGGGGGGGQRDAAAVLALGCAAPLAVAAVIDEWLRDAFYSG